jgi:hypothetical protein
MFNITLAFQNAIYYDKSIDLQKTAKSHYTQHINDISHINDIIWMCNLMEGSIKNHFDHLKDLSRQYSIYLTKIKNNYKIGQICIWMPTNIAPKYSIDELSIEMNQLDNTIRSQINICRKKIYKRNKRRNNRVRAYSY